MGRAIGSHSPASLNQAYKLMELNSLSPAAVAHPSDTQSATFVLAKILASGDSRFGGAREIEGLAHPALLAGGWAVTAQTGAAGRASFGLYPSCDPRRRCVGCSSGCSSERPVLELSRRAGGAPVVWLELGRGNNRLPFMQVHIWMPSSPSLSGIWTPIWNTTKMRMELVSADAPTLAIIEPGGSLAIKQSTTSLRGDREDTARMLDRWTLLVEEQEALDAEVHAAAEWSNNQTPIGQAN